MAEPINLFDIPGIFNNISGLVAAQSKREGGYSNGSFLSLNLGTSTEDDPVLVQKNREQFFHQLKVKEEQIASSFQVHGRRVFVANEATKETGYDAIITNQKNVFACVTVADCVPVLIADPINRAVAAVHAGWRGTTEKIVFETIERMRKEFNTNPKNCLAYVGTCISFESFEVGEEVAVKFESAYKIKKNGKYFVDLKKSNTDQLLDGGLIKENIEISQYCTVKNNDSYFSFRKENGNTGRMLALIGYRE